MFEASHLQYAITSGYIQVVSDGHYLPAFWAHPSLGGPFPGLVLLHDQWGLEADTRSQARRFAAMGYYVIAPDLFNGQLATTPDHARALVEQVGEAAQPRIAAALHALRTHHKCNGTIGLIGWGSGGRLAIQAAMFHADLRAAVAFYGLPDPLTPAELLLIECPLLAICAGQDAAIPPERVEALRGLLAQAGTGHEIAVYPTARRGFFDDLRPEFDPDAARDAWNRALDFLNRHLDAPKPARPDRFEPGPVY